MNFISKLAGTSGIEEAETGSSIHYFIDRL